MSSPATLPLSLIVNVQVNIAPQPPIQPTFNEALIIGTSAVIPSPSGTNPRIREYTSLAQILSDGFTTSSPEYIAAQLYFGQVPAPQILWVGRQNLTALGTVVPHAAQEGTGYVVGDILTVVQTGGSGGQVTVTSVGGSGNITGVALYTDPTGKLQDGTGYSLGTGLATTGGTGTLGQVDITVLGESALAAVQACRQASPAWYACYVAGAAAADHVAIAAYIQALVPATVYFFNTSDAAVLAGSVGNVLSLLKAASYNRAFGLYSTTQSGLFPNNAYAGAAAMGVAMGMNNGLANSAYTMKFKTLVGVAVEPLSLTSINVIEGNNGNLYLNYANSYAILEQGVVPNGQFFDEIINIDMLVSAIEFNVMNLLVGSPKVPQTDAGETQLIHAVNQACETARQLGFIAQQGGVWEGTTLPPIAKTLVAGQTIPNGYLALADAYSNQSASDTAARKAMPIYVAIIEAGAVHFIVIQLNIQR